MTKNSVEKMQIGFVGLGVMGSSIVNHLLDAGFTVNIMTRTKEKAARAIARGAIWFDNVFEVAQHSQLIFTMVGFPSDVEQIYFGEVGLLTGDISGKTFVDLTTSTPTLAKKIAAECEARGAFSLDAPVSGGDLGAQKGTLTVMVGGSQEKLDKLLPIFETFAKQIILEGPTGAGQHTKMANQIMIAGTMTGMTEMLVYASAAGLDLKKVLTTLQTGAAANWSMTNYAPRILQEDYSPGFFVKHFIKDLKIALDEAQKLNIELPATQLATKLYEQLAADGHNNDGTQSLIKLFWPDGVRPDSKK